MLDIKPSIITPNLTIIPFWIVKPPIVPRVPHLSSLVVSKGLRNGYLLMYRDAMKLKPRC